MEQKNINVSLNNASPVVCESCQHDVFISSFLLRKVSRFVTGTPEDVVAPIQVFSCAKCGHTNKDFLPQKEEK